MLSCLETREERFPKDTFLLRTGDTAESIGLVLSGSVLVVQEDIWGNRNILSKAGPDVCRRVCLRARLAAECKRARRNARHGNVPERKARFECVSVRL